MVEDRNQAPQPGRKLRRSEVLLDVAEGMAGIDTLDDALVAFLEIIRAVMGTERGTIFLHDTRTGELFSRVAQGDLKSEIRIPSSSGVAGDVFTAGTSAIVSDAYADPRFNKTVDEETGFKTESILCVPIRAEKGDIIGVVQALNKLDGAFNEDDKRFLEELAVRAADTLNNTQFAERLAPGFKRWLADLWQAWAATRDWR